MEREETIQNAQQTRLKNIGNKHAIRNDPEGDVLFCRRRANLSAYPASQQAASRTFFTTGARTSTYVRVARNTSKPSWV